MSQEFYDRAMEVLAQWRKTPQMYATDYEAWITMVWAVIRFVNAQHNAKDFNQRHLGTYGNTFLNLDKKLDTDWACKVIDDAIFIIKKTKLNAFS